MSQLIQVEPVALLPSPAGCPLFLGDSEKHIVIYIDPSVGAAINNHLSGIKPPRPLSHDLFSDTLRALGAEVLHTTIVKVEGDTFFAKLYLKAENEILEKKIIEIDSRPSDAIALAIRNDAPVFVLSDIWEEQLDTTHLLEEFSSKTAT